MDRLNFSKSIDIDPVTQIKYIFNEIMAMYDLVGKSNYNSINGTINADNTVSFCVVFNSIEEAQNVYDTIINKSVYIYREMYYLNGTINNNIININMVRNLCGHNCIDTINVV